MNRVKLRTVFVCVCAFPALPSFAQGYANTDDLTVAVEEYDKRLRQLEEEDSHIDDIPGHEEITYNPAISVVLDGVYASYRNDPKAYSLPGYALGGEAGLTPDGFSLGHSEIILRSTIDDKFDGQFSIAIADHHNEIEVELEQAFFETLPSGSGFSLRGGRFYSAVGYLNQQHRHVWDFYDAPLIYRGLFGDQYFDDGLRLTYAVPVDFVIKIGAEAFSGSNYPAGGQHSGAGVWTAFASVGDVAGMNHRWQAGLSYMSADNIEREYNGHVHGTVPAEIPSFTGDSQLFGVNAIYQWAPDGAFHDRNVKLQFEYFSRDDVGEMSLLNSNPLESSTLDSQQDGWYLQAIWQFHHHWRTGVRYGLLDSDNTGSDSDVLAETGLIAGGHRPERMSLMAEWIPGEYSRIRLQYNRDDSYQASDDQLYVQYTFIMGSHAAHGL